MTDFLVSMEAISFEKVMFDTDDLSAIRGASWAMLSAAHHFSDLLKEALRNGDPDATVTPLFAGASMARVKVTTSLGEDEVRQCAREVLRGAGGWPEQMKNILPFLVFAVAVTPDANGEAGNDRARAIAQYQGLDVDLPEPLNNNDAIKRVQEDASDALNNGQISNAIPAIALIEQGQPCTKDRTRPIARLSWRSARPEETDGKPRRDVPVSASFYARHDFGRTGRRPAFYKEHAETDLSGKASLADSFEEIAYESQPGGLPVTVRNKMAVLYMDGNAFGKLREAYGDDGTFAEEMREQRTALLKGLVELFLNENYAKWLQLKEPKKRYLEDGKRDVPVLRFETLLWGADEAMFVFPGWALLPVLAWLEELLKTSECGELEMQGGQPLPLTYGIGVAVGHYKTPIRAMKRLAQELGENAKARGKAGAGGLADMKSFVDIMLLGGIDLPARSLKKEREALFNIPPDVQDDVFPLPLDGFADIIKALERVRGISGDADVGLPRAKLADLLNQALEAGEIHTEAPQLAEKLQDLLSSGRDADGESLEGVFEDIHWTQEKRPLVPLLHLALLWNHLGLIPLPNKNTSTAKEEQNEPHPA